jgi:hypothetical protein
MKVGVHEQTLSEGTVSANDKRLNYFTSSWLMFPGGKLGVDNPERPRAGS